MRRRDSRVIPEASIAAAIFFLICVIPVHGDGPAGDDRLESLKPVIESLLGGIDGASVELNSRGLEVAYRVQEFQVHPVMKDGTISARARTERGPNKGGFLLHVSVRPDPQYSGPIMLSPEGYGLVRHPYWETQVREIRLQTDEHVWVTLATGLNANTVLIHELQTAIYDHMMSGF